MATKFRQNRLYLGLCKRYLQIFASIRVFWGWAIVVVVVGLVVAEFVVSVFNVRGV